MADKRVIGGNGYDWSKGRTMNDMKAEAKWKEAKDRRKCQKKTKNK